jgi:hypothetical protein
MTKNPRNVILTRFHPNCRLCHYAGFSNLCTFFETGKCPYAEGMSMDKARERNEE